MVSKTAIVQGHPDPNLRLKRWRLFDWALAASIVLMVLNEVKRF
jgi:hypothetical protein